MSTKPLTHIAIIMDGNRRWASQRGLPLGEGHRKVADDLIEDLALHCIERKIPYLTMWVFSTENWGRDPSEVNFLLNLFREMLQDNIERLHKHGIKVQMIGDPTRFPVDIQQSIEEGLVETANNDQLTLTFALNYGGRDEIIRAVRKIAEEVEQEQLETDNISETVINNHLDTVDLPAPDLIIRPGGEQRLSGFLPWQGVYAELYFTDTLMPDFDETALDKAIDEYHRRQRRFGL